MSIKISTTYLLILLFHITSFGQKGLLPDDNFEQALIDLGYDIAPLDDSVVIADVNEIISLDISALGILDLTGIKYFTALEQLNCSFNGLSSIDLSYNANLEDLNCEFNGLYSLVVSENLALKKLYFGYNEVDYIDLSNNFLLEELSFVGNSLSSINLLENTELRELTCTGNPILSLNLIGNPNLELLECSGTSITALDVLSNEQLHTLICSSNGLVSLDLTNAVELVFLRLDANNLSEIDLSHSPLLEEVYVGFNDLSELNLTANTALKKVDIRNNELIYLDIRNGENTAIEVFKATENPLLTCIDVDNVEWSESNWTEIDAGANFSIECRLSLPELDVNYNVYPNPTSAQVHIQSQLPFTFEIYSIEGSLLQTGSGNTDALVDLSELPAGMYFLNLVNEHVTQCVRVIKE